MFKKKEGGTAVGNILRGIKNVALPMVDVVDDLILGGKLGDAMDLIKRDSMTTGNNPPLTADDVAKVTEALAADVQHSRQASLVRLQSDKVPTPIKYVPSFIDVVVILIWGFTAIYLLIIAGAQVMGKAGMGDTVLAMAVFTATTTMAKDVLGFHRGGNNQEQNEHAARMLGHR